MFKISLAGDLGAGKSTVAEILVKKFGAEKISAGFFQRKLAKKLNMTIEQFNRHMEQYPKFDIELDNMLKEYDKKEGSYIFDSRLAFNFVPSAVSFYLKVDPNEAARRVFSAKRSDESYTSEQEALEYLKKRRESERKRYKSCYGLDIDNMNNYNFVIDTTNLPPQAVADEIERLYFKKVGL